MKLKTGLKKGLTLGLATMVAAQGVHAEYWDTFLDSSLMNVTPSGTITKKDSSGNVESRTFYTTSVYFKFGPAFDYPEPILNLSGPQMSAGCGGLSIKGMFGSIIGLDRLEQMLKNAGASFAWGIAVGLIYSLPGIGAAFKMINNWAKKIQQLLGNACQSGQNLGKFIADESGFSDAIQDNWLTQADNAVAGLDQSLKNKFDNMNLGNYFDDNMVFGMPSDTSRSNEAINSDYREFLIGGLVTYSFAGNTFTSYMHSLTPDKGVELIKDIFNVNSINDIPSYSTTEFKVTFDNANATQNVFSMDTLLNNYGSAIATDQKNDMARSFMQTAIARYVAGDTIIAGDNTIQTLLDKISAVMDDSTNLEARKKAETTVADLLQGKNKSFSVIQDNVVGSEIESFSEELVNYLLYGNTTGDASENTPHSAAFKVKAITYGAIALPSSTEDNQANSKTIVFYAKSNTHAGETSWFKHDSDKQGAWDRSKELIEALTEPSAFNSSLEDIESQIGIGLLVPGIINKIMILQQTPKEHREGLKNALADYNAYHTVIGSLKGILDNGTLTRPEAPILFVNSGNIVRSDVKKLRIPDNRSDGFADSVNNSQKAMKDLADKALKQLNQKFANRYVKSAQELEDMFNKQHTANLKSSVKLAK
jgi:hypothetical protein